MEPDVLERDTADVVIIGGGAVGCATAYALTHAASAPERVIIIERDPSYRESSTPRSAGGVRQQFSTPENILLSQATLHLLRHLEEQFGAGADLSFREQGYLILASADGRQILTENIAVQRSHGADIRLLSAIQLADHFPWLNTDNIIIGSFGAKGEGWIDPSALTTLLRRAAIANGAELIHDTVTSFQFSAGKITTCRNCP